MSSNPDSFIDEVTEAVRHDRMYAALKRYGWIGILAIVLIVGGAAWREWSKARGESQAQVFGDAVMAAFATPDPQAALAAITPSGDDQRMLLTLFEASAAKDADKLAALYADTRLPAAYRQLAEFRRLLLITDMDPIARAAAFSELTTPGAPFRLLAEEQIALIEIGQGKNDKAIARLKALSEDTEASGALRGRAQQLIVALGGAPAG